ncbi:MAG: Holliday junction branch migration protein RuvA [Patescibacteria group bacterium]
MITSLTGTILARGADYVIIDVAGVGYRVVCAAELLAQLTTGTTTTLFTHEAIRDDGREIFGFSTLDALELFWQLIAVSGVGPRTGLAILAMGSPPTVRSAIERGDIGAISSAHGVGKKTAQKIVLELKGKLVDADDGPTDDLQDALVTMGYGKQEAAAALRTVSIDLPDAERLKQTLALLKRK